MSQPSVKLFQRATKKQLKARIALLGPAGSGKSYTALRLAFTLAGPTGRVAAIDTEHRSLSKYVGESPDGYPWEFDVLELESFAPENYIEGIHAAEDAGYDVLVIDSLSHAWAGKDGILEFVDETAKKAAVKSGRENTFVAWREATPKHNELVEAMLGAQLHVIVTMRVKTEYIQDKDPQTGKSVIRKIGLQPIQRDGLEYEFDVVADLDLDHNLVVSKTRCSAIDGKLYTRPGSDLAGDIKNWLENGEPQEQPAPQAVRTASNGSQHGWEQIADDLFGEQTDEGQLWGIPRSWVDRLVERVGEETGGYYRHLRHIENTLRKEGVRRVSKENATEAIQILVKHAQENAGRDDNGDKEIA